MGIEWLSWVGGGGNKSAKSGRFSRELVENNDAPPPSGCMCAVFQIFDLNNHFLQPPLKPGANNFLPDEPTVVKGVEAPRNSLELEEPSCEAARPLSSTMNDNASLNFPMGIQIRTSCDTKSPRESTSECSSSSPASTKTPGVVARLMGLDLLPEGGSPSLLSSSRHSTSSSPLMKSRLHNHQQEDRSRHLLQNKPPGIRNTSSGATHSLPATPRVSTARRSDVDHRLSLQIDKENVGEKIELAAYIAQKMVARRREAMQEDESRSPGHHARQIVKQVKESVGRKVGVDITNIIKSRDHHRQLKDYDQVVLPKPKKPSRALTRVGDECSPGKQSTPSCSPRLRFLDTKSKASATTLPDKNQTPPSPKASPSPKLSSATSLPDKTSKPKPNVQLPQQKNNQEKSSMQKCEEVSSERYNSRLKKPRQASDNAVRNKKEETFVRSPSRNDKVNYLTADKMCKKIIPLSNELPNNNVPALLPAIKKDTSPALKLIHKQVSPKRRTQLSSCASQSYNQEATHASTILMLRSSRDRCDGATTFAGSGEEYHRHHFRQYLQMILKRTDMIDNSISSNNPSVSVAKWYSPSHPLDPAAFHHIELFHHTNPIFTAKDSKLRNRSIRKLIFQLVDELLAEILDPCVNFKITDGSELIETLCSRIEAFPSANCKVLEDVDALIERDFKVKWSSAFAEEAESVVSEIEHGVVESLVHEMVLEAWK